MIRYFRTALLEWFQRQHRPLPWKADNDPYNVWLSEIILQQTRVEQGLPYYLKFKDKYPDVQALAEADEEEVLRLWQGLGYYSRARNLLKTARQVVEAHNGRFPKDYRALLKLKGIGPYTAAAIASFAFNRPEAVVDGNVYRVIARFFGIDTPIDSTAGRQQFRERAQELICRDDPATYNQAIMDFGAMQCTPKKPDCPNCPLRPKCFAFQNQAIARLPVKAKKIIHRKRYFNYLVITERESGKCWLKKRTEKDIWQNLYNYPLIESDGLLKRQELRATAYWLELFDNVPAKITEISQTYRQTLTHQKIFARFFKVEIPAGAQFQADGLVEAEKNTLTKFAFPKIINCYLADKALCLSFD